MGPELTPTGGWEPPGRGGTPSWVLPVVVGGTVGTLLGLGLWWAVGAGDDDGRADSGAPGPLPTQSTTTTVPEPPAALTGTWHGTYECGEGERELVLTVVDSDGQLDAVFEFGGPDDPPAGAFTMRGAFDGEGGVELEAEDWIDRPEDYVPVDLLGDATRRDIVGRVEGEGCGDFRVERTTAEPWYVGTWTGSYECRQGLTGLTLTVEAAEAEGAGAVTADFSFSALAANPDVPSGRYSMEGRYDDGELTLEGDEWIDRPGDYEMVGLESDADRPTRPDILAGRMTDDDCGFFDLRRAS